MTETFLPEGRRLDTAANRRASATAEGLVRAMAEGQILEGTALRCTPEHDLIVSLGPFTGVIPRPEAVLEDARGQVREIAVLSRVGRTVCCVVTGLEAWPDGSLRPVLSRRLAQKAARDHFLSALRPGDILPATVTHLKPFGAFVDMGCGLVSLIGIERISVSRISHAAQRFSSGQEIFAALLDIDRPQRRFLLTHRELLGTWAEHAARFSPGDTVPGYVRGVRDYGLFIELAPNLSGLAEYRPGLKEGDRVSVFLKSMDPERRKIKLVVIDLLPPLDRPDPPVYFRTAGRLERWQYGPEGSEKPGPVTLFPPEPLQSSPEKELSPL